jgi:methionyl aminopeptidase
MSIDIKTKAQIEKMRLAGRLAAEVLDMLRPLVVPGVSTAELDERAHDYIVTRLNAVPGKAGYRGFERTLGTSINGVVWNGVPSEKDVLRDGDIVGIEVALIKNSWFGATTRTFLVGKPDAAAKRLVTATEAALAAAIGIVREGARLGDIGHAIERVAKAAGFSVVREYCGHGIGRGYHEEPEVAHHGRLGSGLWLKKGMVFTIEPMLNAGGPDVENVGDAVEVVTSDGELSAQAQHTVLVTETGAEVLTAWADRERAAARTAR